MRADETEEQETRCRQCHRRIRLGEDIMQLQRGVIGPRGFVQLDEPASLCSDACLRGYVNGSDEEIEKLSRRIP